MKFSRKKINRILKDIGMDMLRIAVYLFLIFLAVLAVCIFVSLPEIIGALIFG